MPEKKTILGRARAKKPGGKGASASGDAAKAAMEKAVAVKAKPKAATKTAGKTATKTAAKKSAGKGTAKKATTKTAAKKSAGKASAKTATKTAPKSETKTAPKKSATETATTTTTTAAKESEVKATTKTTTKAAPKRAKSAKTSSRTSAKPKKFRGERPAAGPSRPTRQRLYRPGPLDRAQQSATANLKRGEGEGAWVIVDAEGLVLGRMASRIALRLKGKHLPTYTPHADAGDTVIVVNAEKVALTGMKERGKEYYRHTGYVGGIKRTTPFELRARHPERLVELAVSRMLARGPLGRRQMRRLKVYSGGAHPHEAQSPVVWDLGGENEKNRVRR